jgi:hypothetical protein
VKTPGQPFQFVTAVGRIPEQIIHKHTGLEIGPRVGERGQQHVRENFLVTANLRRYLTLFVRYVLSASPGGDVPAA